LFIFPDMSILRFSFAVRLYARFGKHFPGRHARAPMEMRNEIRYQLDAPAVFSWEGEHHRRFLGEGITRDISVQGAFILTATMPPPDCPIQVDLHLPSLTGIKSTMRITGKARVIRVEHSSSDTWIHGFAVVTDDLNQWGLMTMHDESEIAVVGAARAH
jgi:hypothetical protein